MSALNHTLGVQGAGAAVSFGGAGFLIVYYVGIVESLTALGVITSSSKLAGSSSGALIATSHCSGLPPVQTYKAAEDLAKSCRSHMSCSGTLDKELRRVLQQILPPDAYQRCRNKGYIAITTGQLLMNDHHPLLVTDFKDQPDLIAAAACSSYIPLWSAASMVTHFRGLQVYDGGFASQQPCPPDVSHCIRVSTSNPAWPRRSTVSTFMARVAMRGPLALVASNSKAKKYPPIVPTGKDGADPAMIKLAADAQVDIAPGIFHQVAFSQDEWNGWALSPADDSTLKYIYELGKADGAAWAKHKASTKQ